MNYSSFRALFENRTLAAVEECPDSISVIVRRLLENLLSFVKRSRKDNRFDVLREFFVLVGANRLRHLAKEELDAREVEKSFKRFWNVRCRNDALVIDAYERLKRKGYFEDNREWNK